MVPHPADDPETTPDLSPITDPGSLRDRPGVPVHEDHDTVDEETLDEIAALDDLAPVGVTNERGEVLLVRVTADCALKLPSSAVPAGADFVASARAWVAEQAGIDLAIDGVEAVWRLEARLADGSRTATRHFVVFSATPSASPAEAEERSTATATTAAAHTVRWVDDLPTEAAAVPGTELFFD
jgi:hypothetical protein